MNEPSAKAKALRKTVADRAVNRAYCHQYQERWREEAEAVAQLDAANTALDAYIAELESIVRDQPERLKAAERDGFDRAKHTALQTVRRSSVGFCGCLVDLESALEKSQ